MKPLALREQPYLPFGPSTMPRPWTGRKPLPESKKKLPEFDSFKLPPPGKKGVKPVQSPGPFLMGSGPKEKPMTREEVLGEPLTAEEVKELVKGCLKTRRQLNMGWLVIFRLFTEIRFASHTLFLQRKFEEGMVINYYFESHSTVDG